MQAVEAEKIVKGLRLQRLQYYNLAFAAVPQVQVACKLAVYSV